TPPRSSPANASPPTFPPYVPSQSRSAPAESAQTPALPSHSPPAAASRAAKGRPEIHPAKTSAGKQKITTGKTAGSLPEQYQKAFITCHPDRSEPGPPARALFV